MLFVCFPAIRYLLLLFLSPLSSQSIPSDRNLHILFLYTYLYRIVVPQKLKAVIFDIYQSLLFSNVSRPDGILSASKSSYAKMDPNGNMLARFKSSTATSGKLESSAHDSDIGD